MDRWGYLWNHCGWASAPKCGGRDSVGGRATAPMYDRRDSVGGRSTSPMYDRRGSVCGRATSPMCDKRGSVGGRAIAPMCDKRGSVCGRATTAMCDKRGSVCERATAPMCCRWVSLSGPYRWWQLADDSLHDHAGATCRVVGDGFWRGHGSTSNCYVKKWIRVCTSHGASWCSV